MNKREPDEEVNSIEFKALHNLETTRDRSVLVFCAMICSYSAARGVFTLDWTVNFEDSPFAPLHTLREEEMLALAEGRYTVTLLDPRGLLEKYKKAKALEAIADEIDELSLYDNHFSSNKPADDEC